MFMSLTGLVLDYTFISKNEPSDSVIVKQRILVFIPTIISLFIGLFPILINISSKKYYVSGADALLLGILMKQ